LPSDRGASTPSGRGSFGRTSIKSRSHAPAYAKPLSSNTPSASSAIVALGIALLSAIGEEVIPSNLSSVGHETSDATGVRVSYCWSTSRTVMSSAVEMTSSELNEGLPRTASSRRENAEKAQNQLPGTFESSRAVSMKRFDLAVGLRRCGFLNACLMPNACAAVRRAPRARRNCSMRWTNSVSTQLRVRAGRELRSFRAWTPPSSKRCCHLRAV
jgi:hypothetical protein